MLDSIYNLWDVDRTEEEKKKYKRPAYSKKNKIQKVTALIIGRQMYWFGNWFRILISTMILCNQSADTWTTHSRHPNGEIIDVVAQRHNLMGSWQSLEFEGIRVEGEPRGQWIHSAGVPSSPLGGPCTLACLPCSWALPPSLLLQPWAHPHHGCSGKTSDGRCFVSGRQSNAWGCQRQTKTHRADASLTSLYEV